MAVPLMAIGAGVQGLNSLYNTWQGYRQRSRGEDMLRSLKRPTYNTPGEVDQSLSLAEGQYRDTRLPGQAQAENKLNASSSQAIRQIRDNGKSPSEILGAAVAVNANQNEGYNELAVAGADRQLQDLMNYQKALGNKADYTEKEWMYNSWMPYMQDRQYAESLIGAGAKNFNTGVNDFASGVATASEPLSALLDKMRARKYQNFKSGLSFKPPGYGESDNNPPV